MSQKTITVGTAGIPADLDVNFGNAESNFDEIYADKAVQDVAIALNTAKDGISTSQASAIAANTLKVTYPGPQDISGKEAVGVAAGLVSNHTTTHPAPTTRDARSQVVMGVDENYVSDSELGILQVTSGVNTGDQDLSGLATKTIATPVKSAAYTVGTDNTDEAYGGVVYTSSTGIITLPVLAVGMHLAVIAAGGVIVTIDPNGVDKIIIDGTDATAGVTITSPGDVGDIAVLTYHSAGTWFASTNTWGMGA